MALEDEIINIEDLDIAKEIKIGDFILLETTDGTKLIDFKDFIIGTDNITFYDKISGGEFLQVADISALSAAVDTHSTILSSISGVNDDINSLSLRIDAVGGDLSKLVSQINTTSDVALDTNTSNTVGFSVSRTAETPYSPGSTVSFTNLDFKGTGLSEATSGDGSISIGDTANGFQYTAKGSYNLYLIGEITIRSSTGIDRLQILKNGQTFTEYQVAQDFANISRIVKYGTFSINKVLRLNAGDKITFGRTGGGIVTSGNITGAII